jgi:phosphoribosylanthranilate isomerase
VQAAAIETAAGIPRVGVFVNEPREAVERIARLTRLQVAQLHGRETEADYPAGLIVWKAFRCGEADVSAFEDCPAEALLLDGPAERLYGGSGKTFDWSVAATIRKRVILAGGLDASNVARAIAIAHPWGVDACSRVEIEPRKKDHQKMNAFLQAARAALSV